MHCFHFNALTVVSVFSMYRKAYIMASEDSVCHSEQFGKFFCYIIGLHVQHFSLSLSLFDWEYKHSLSSFFDISKALKTSLKCLVCSMN